MARAIAAFFMGSWGILTGLFFAGLFVSVGHPVKPFDHAMWGIFAVFFSSMTCIGTGRYINDQKFGRTLAAISGITIALVFLARGSGWI